LEVPNYVLPAKRNQEAYRNLQQAGSNLRGLIRVLLFKRFESSVHAFRTTIDRQITTHQRFLAALDRGFIPAGKDAQKLLVTEIGGNEEADLTEAVERVSGKYNIADFDADALIRDIQADLNVLLKIRTLVEPITPDRDAKLQTLKAKLIAPLLKSKKRLIFTQYADTAQYLYDNLQAEHNANNLEVIHSGNDRDKTQIVARFAPKANPDTHIEPETELQTLIATDILAEGLNLQDGDAIINYDLHWNPVKLIQRFGRIDRIGSEKDVIYGFNFLPERNLERNLGLQQVLQARIREIHDSIGEDSAILDRSEQLNEKAMYAIYEQQGEQLDELDPADADMEFLDLNEAEEILRRLQKDNPAEFDRIESLPNGIRSATLGNKSGTFVFCEAKQPNQPQQKSYQQLFLVNDDGEIISRDLPHILAAISAQSTTPTATLPANYNQAVMAVLRLFKAEVKERAAEQKQRQLSQAQRYVLRELGWLFKATDDLDLQAKIGILDRAFQGKISRAVDREINALQQRGVKGEALFSELVTIYNQHHLGEVRELDRSNDDSPIVSTIICSEAI
jgi:Helicase conserved C-terminal domain